MPSFKPLALLSAICLLLFPSLLMAEQNRPVNERDYRVEVVIFSQIPGAGVTEGMGTVRYFEPVSEPAQLLGSGAAWQRLGFSPLALIQPQPTRLNREVEALTRSSDYEVLFHQAWIMPIVAEDRSPLLLLEGGRYFDLLPELQGSLRLSVARYLHIETDLSLSVFEPVSDPSVIVPPLYSSLDLDEPQPDLQPSYQAIGAHHLQQRRRMRSGELHYLDTPYLGLLIRIDRTE